jgi:MerR family transcriptional regulator/heat shock protein HspR
MSDDEPALFLISTIAKMLNIHPQTLRLYEREGFIQPARTQGNSRLYSQRDVDQLRLVLHLTRDLGVNLAGIAIILRMRGSLETLQQEIVILQQEISTYTGSEPNGVVRPYALIRATSRMLVKVS